MRGTTTMAGSVWGVCWLGALALAIGGCTVRQGGAAGRDAASAVGDDAGDAGSASYPDVPIVWSDAGLRDVGPLPDGFCGGETIPLTHLPARLVFVVDRSSSTLGPSDRTLMPMGTDLGSCATTNARPATGITYRTLWDDLASAVSSVSVAREDRVELGLTLFPGPGPIEGAITGSAFCTARPPSTLVTPALSTASAISAAMTDPANLPLCAGGFTPTRSALEEAAASLGGVADGVLVLATDGAPNCGTSGAPGCTCTTSSAFCGALGTIGCLDDTGTLDEITALRARGVRTYVVGVPGTEAYADLLDAMAMAGGTARIGAAEAYYRADDAAALVAALGTIADHEVSCRFELASPPPDREHVNVTLDGAPIPRDPASGWVLAADGSSIELVGEPCDRLRAGTISSVQFLFGCPYVF